MANLGLSLSGKKYGSATFHVEQGSNERWRRRKKSPMGPVRTVLSAVSICFGLFMAYTALHYVPAIMTPSQIVRATDLDDEILKEDRGLIMSLVGPYWDSLQSRKAFIWRGEALEIQYRLAKGQTMDLQVKRCARQFVIEIFDCQVVSQQTVRVSRQNGIERLHFSEPGFYHFEEVVQSGPPPRVVWRRA